MAHNIAWLKVGADAFRLLRLTAQEFLSLLAPDEMPDYIAVHVYTTTFDSFKSTVEKFWDEFRLPIWVTEFAMTVCLTGRSSDIELIVQSLSPLVPNPRNQQQVHDFMGT